MNSGNQEGNLEGTQITRLYSSKTGLAVSNHIYRTKHHKLLGIEKKNYYIQLEQTLKLVLTSHVNQKEISKTKMH